MTAKGVRRLLFTACVLAALRFSSPRTLQQSSQSYRVSTKLFSGVGEGGLALISNYTLTYSADGTVSSGTVNETSPGFPLVLTSGDLLLSNTYTNVGCFQVGLRPSSDGIGGFVSTYADIIGTTTSNGIFRISTATILEGSNVSATGDNTLHSAAADPDEQYVFVVYNLGDYIGSARAQITALTAEDCAQSPMPAPMASQVPFVADTPALAPEESEAEAPALGTGRKLKQFYDNLFGYGSPAEGPSLTEQAETEGRNAPAPGPAAEPSDSVQLLRQDALSDSSLLSNGGFTDVSCIAYKLMGQKNTRFGSLPQIIDTSVFLLDEDDTLNWASQSFSLTPDNVNFQAITLQNNDNNADQFTYIDGLNTSAKYFLWTVTGMQQADVVSSNVVVDLAFTAQAVGSCSDNLVNEYPGTYEGFGSPAPGAATSQSESSASGPEESSSSLLPSDASPEAAPEASTAGNTAASPGSGIQLQGGGDLFPLPGKKLKLLR